MSVDTIEAVAGRIERAVQEGADKEVPSTRIGEAVMEALHDLDAVAYVRFASYRSFRDISEFINELKDILHTKESTKDPRKEHLAHKKPKKEEDDDTKSSAPP